MVTWNDENVAHLLARAGFGASAKDVVKYLKVGQAAAVEKLVAINPSAAKGPGISDYDPDTRAKLKSWWAKRMVKASSRRLQFNNGGIFRHYPALDARERVRC